MSRWSGWRPALRIARRDVLRAKGRSALVVAMVGLPVALVTCFATINATNDVTPVESIPSRLGTATAALRVDSGSPVYQDPTGDLSGPRSDGIGEQSTAQPPPSLDAKGLQRITGGTVVDLPSLSTLVRTDRGRIQADVLVADASSPLLDGMFDVVRGRAPRADDEVLVTRDLAQRGYGPGRTISLADGATPARVVGVSAVPDGFFGWVVIARPGLGLAAGGDVTHRYLLDRGTPVLWPEVLRLNEAGVNVFSKAVVENPPADWRNTVPSDVGMDGGSDAALNAVVVLVIFSVVLEVVLLAGPAFAVGVRRQSRQLALVAATGGSSRDVRRIVLAQALTLGVGAAVIGAGLGIGVAAVLAQVLPRVSSLTLGPWDVNWLYVGIAFALGACASLAAALAPAVSAARADVVAVLAGRRGRTRTRRGWPVLGAVVAAGGAAVALTLGTRPGGEFAVAGGTLAMVLGAIAGIPAVIGLVGRLGARLPLPLRLAARDSARQRGRTAPAVAAVMAAVAGVTALAIGSSSDFEQQRREYQPRYPAGVTVVESPALDAAGWRGVQESARSVAGRAALPYGSVGQASTGTSVDSQPLSLYVPAPGCPDRPSPNASTPQEQRCQQWQTGGDPDVTSYGGRSPLVATVAALRALGYDLDDGQAALLENRGVLLPAASLVRDGHANLVWYSTSPDGTSVTTTSTDQVVAGYLAPTGQVGSGGLVTFVDAIMTPATADAQGVPWHQAGVVLAPSAQALGTDDEDRLTETLQGVSPDVSVYTERGFVEKFTVQFVGLSVIGGLAVLVGTLTATGLSLADSRPDLATLAAIGARPRTRRLMAASQALVIGLLGALAGVLVGVVPGLAVTWPLTSQRLDRATGQYTSGQNPIIDVPWLLLLAVGVAVPVVAAAAAGLGVRSRLPLTRRLGQ